jgi:hypothetical protein
MAVRGWPSDTFIVTSRYLVTSGDRLTDDFMYGVVVVIYEAYESVRAL